MSHYPTHLRDPFCAWVEEGAPDIATVEVHYEDTEEPAEIFLRRFLLCSDVPPRVTRDELQGLLGLDRDDNILYAYGTAAAALLADRRRETRS